MGLGRTGRGSDLNRISAETPSGVCRCRAGRSGSSDRLDDPSVSAAHRARPEPDSTLSAALGTDVLAGARRPGRSLIPGVEIGGPNAGEMVVVAALASHTCLLCAICRAVAGGRQMAN